MDTGNIKYKNKYTYNIPSSCDTVVYNTIRRKRRNAENAEFPHAYFINHARNIYWYIDSPEPISLHPILFYFYAIGIQEDCMATTLIRSIFN